MIESYDQLNLYQWDLDGGLCLPYSLGMSFKAGVLQRFDMSGGAIINNESVEDLPFHRMTISVRPSGGGP